MSKKFFIKNGYITTGIIIIVGLIISIIFLLRINSHQKNKSNLPSSPEGEVFQLFGDYNPKYLDLSKYQDEKGKIRSVNTTIKPIFGQEYQYSNTTNNFQSFFPKASEKLKEIKIQKNNASITFEIISQLSIDGQDQSSNLNFANSQTITSADGQKNRIKYSQIFQKDNFYLDAIYTVHQDKLQEEIVVNKFFGTPQISQKLKLVNTYAKNQGDRIYFYQKNTDDILWFIPKPKMYEQKNQSNSNFGISYELKCQDNSLKIENCNQLILTKKINEDGQRWLTDANRQYPIIIDPDFQIDNADTASNWVSSDSTNFTVSQENNIRQEGTGSVKIVAIGNIAAWGINGSADVGCTYSSYSSGSVYSSCSAPNLCTGTNCYANGGSCCGTVYSSYSSGVAYTGCSAPNLCTGTNCYANGGSCCTGTLYSSYSSGTVYTSCGSATLCSNTNCWTYGGVCDSGCNYNSRTYNANYYYTNAGCYSTNCTSCASANNSTCDSTCRYHYSGYSMEYTYWPYTACDFPVSSWKPYNTCTSAPCYRSCTLSSGWKFYTGCIDAPNRCLSQPTSCAYWITPKRYSVSSPVSGYSNFSSGCASGSGSCYKRSGGQYAKTGCSACDGTCTGCVDSPTYFYTSSPACTWVAAQYQYPATGATTGYWTFTGSCSAGTPATCYQINGSATSNVISGACGSGGCGTSGTSYKTAPTTCTWAPAQYSYTATGSTTGYWSFTGPCSAGNPATCYQRNGSSANRYTNASCGSSGCNSTSGTYYTAPTTCTWAPAQYSYTATGSTTGYWSFTGTCASGSGSCYKRNGSSANRFTNASCGSSGCNSTSGTYYTAPTTCTWYSGSSLNDTATFTRTAINLSDVKEITFWVRSTRTGSFMRFQMGESISTEQTFAFTINSANTWEKKTWNISSITSTARDAITKFAFENTNDSSAFTFYFDNIQAISDINYPNSVCTIEESPDDSYLTINWTDITFDETGFQIEKNTNNTGFSFLTNTPSESTSYLDNSISSNNIYSYRIRSYVASAGSTTFSNYVNCPVVNLGKGSLRLEGIQLEGLQFD